MENSWKDFQTLEQFADYVRGQASLIMGKAAYRENMEIFHLAASLCTLSTNIYNQSEMAQELTSDKAYSLSALSVDLQAEHPERDPEDEDNPFRDE